MRHHALILSRARAPLIVRCLRDWCRDTRGTTAIEFALVGMPFLIFMISAMSYGLYWLNLSDLNHAVTATSREIRTGSAQKKTKDADGNPATAETPVTVGDFKDAVCRTTTSLSDCLTAMKVHVQTFGTWDAVDPVSCFNDSGVGLRNSDEATLLKDVAGGASSVVLVTTCYPWDFAATLPWLMLSAKKPDGTKRLNGAALLQATTIFRNEPYE